MELQFVHRSQDGQVLILAVFLEQQSTNRDLSRLWSSIPTTGDTAAEPIPLDPARLLPNRRKYYQYEGSLTHPPCTEGVHWYVLTDPLNISNQQLEHFSHLVPFNARPVQSLNGRKVTRSTRN
jgi:carbonic anhydrase